MVRKEKELQRQGKKETNGKDIKKGLVEGRERENDG